ncbi:odorant receptor 13a-like isoform X2 [Prorops nasuta]|uniref:odorant receptor 13a-like isoform X2 n=1 Tax=Prorops nasuta TaxID=863751 RepID=UPI0034CD30B3
MDYIRKGLLILGLWPEDHQVEKDFSILRYRSLAVLVLLIIFLLVPQSANLIFVYNDLVLITENLANVNVVAVTAIMKISVMKSNRKVLGEVIRSYMKDWISIKDKEDRETMTQWEKVARKIIIGFLIMMVVVSAVVTFQKVFLIVQAEMNGTERGFIFQSYFPPICKVTPYYQMTCLGQVMATYCLASVYTVVDCMVYMLIFHVYGQFLILQRALIQTINSKQNLQDPHRFKKGLGFVVRKHERLNWVAETVEDSFNICFLFQVLFSTLVMCFQGFLVFKEVSVSENFPANEVFFLVSGMRDAVYESDWYMLSPNNMKMLLFIVHRSNRPLKLTAGKFSVFSMQTFAKIVKTAVGYLSVLVGLEAV